MRRPFSREVVHPWLSAGPARHRPLVASSPEAAAKPARPRRITELDALRGLAAVTVVAGHSMTVFPNFNGDTRGDSALRALNVLKYSPLALFHAGDAAVILFFVLSGFVLALPFSGGRRPVYMDFLVRRVCRIYLPYLAAVVVAVIAAAALGGSPIRGMSEWVNLRWQGHFDAHLLLGHATLLPSFDNAQFDPVLWSLVHEMRISLFFPLLVLAVAVCGPTRAVLAAGAVLVFATVAQSVAHTDAGSTLNYVPCFMVGIVLARQREELTDWFGRLGTGARIGLGVAGVLAYTYSSWMSPAWFSAAHTHLADDIAASTVGAAAFIVLAMGSPAFSRFLRHRIPQYLGRISYSLYLVHAVVLLSLLHALHGHLPTGVIVLLMWPIAFALATAAERWIEQPAIRLGRKAARWERPQRSTNPRADAPDLEPARASV